MNLTHVVLERQSWKNAVKMVEHFQKAIPSWRRKIPEGPLVFLLHETAIAALHHRTEMKKMLKQFQKILKEHDAHLFFSTYELSLSRVSNTGYILSGTQRKALSKKAGTNVDSAALMQIAKGIAGTEKREVKAITEYKKLKQEWIERSKKIEETQFPTIKLKDNTFELRVCADVAVPPMSVSQAITLVPALNLPKKLEEPFASLRDAVIINDIKPRAYLRETGNYTLDLSDELTLKKVNLLLKKRGIKIHLTKEPNLKPGTKKVT